MAKNFLDEILKEDKKSFFETENDVLSQLLDEINLITDDSIVSFVRSVLLKAQIFWDIPSSFSDKYHPGDEHGVGGNVLHTKRVVRVATILADSYCLSDDERNIILAACLLHDITKGIADVNDDSCFHYDPMHPYTVATFVQNCQLYDKEHGNDSQSTSLFVSEESIQSILRLIRCHLGPWSPVPETYPITYLDYIVHIADSVASKIHTVIEDSELINEKWRKQAE